MRVFKYLNEVQIVRSCVCRIAELYNCHQKKGIVFACEPNILSLFYCCVLRTDQSPRHLLLLASFIVSVCVCVPSLLYCSQSNCSYSIWKTNWNNVRQLCVRHARRMWRFVSKCLCGATCKTIHRQRHKLKLNSTTNNVIIAQQREELTTNKINKSETEQNSVARNVVEQWHQIWQLKHSHRFQRIDRSLAGVVKNILKILSTFFLASDISYLLNCRGCVLRYRRAFSFYSFFYSFQYLKWFSIDFVFDSHGTKVHTCFDTL